MTQKYKKRLPEGPFYRDLGRTIRLLRSAAGKTQLDTAEHIDVTFQQFQKYESGANRIPIDRLISLADYLEVPLSQFIDATGGRDNAAIRLLIEQFDSKEFQILLKSWTVLDSSVRAAILNFVKAMAAMARAA